MSETAFTVSGLWSGWYSYTTIELTVPFTAWLFDVDGIISGTTLEPNTFADPALKDLSAEISGLVGTSFIRFEKVYEPVEGADPQPVVYNGIISDNGKEIHGQWSISHDEGRATGRFSLNRTSGDIAHKRQTFDLIDFEDMLRQFDDDGPDNL